MLDAYIIEEIKKRDEDRRRREDAARPRLRIEVPDPRSPIRREEHEGEHPENEDGPDGEAPIRIDLAAG